MHRVPKPTLLPAMPTSAPAPAAATDLQIVDEVWKVVDENVLPARAADGFDRARWARLCGCAGVRGVVRACVRACAGACVRACVRA